MNKDEMIKDIRAIIDDRCEAELGQVHAESKGVKVTKTVSTSLIAKDIYNANYRKVADDEIVVKKEDVDYITELYREKIEQVIKWRNLCDLKIKETRQETAREILQYIHNKKLSKAISEKYGIELED